MEVSNELQPPSSDKDFEAMCLQLYAKVFGTNDLMQVGRSGQPQNGVDILGTDGQRSIGIQCKAYKSTKFTLDVINKDIEKADKAKLQIKHLFFATTAPSDAEIVRAVHKLSQDRQARGAFAVSVDFWNSICSHILLYPEIGRAFIPNFPGNTLLAVVEKTDRILEILESNKTIPLENKQEFPDHISNRSVSKSPLPLDARGDESDPVVVERLDNVRNYLREGKTDDARKLLEKLGNPDTFKDKYSKFRWHTNTAVIASAEEDEERAADEFLKAFNFAPDDPKAHTNRVQAYLFRKKFETADIACEEALANFPDNAVLWGLRLHTCAAVENEVPETLIPAHVKDSTDFLFSKSRLLGKRGDSCEAIALLERCLALDGGSLDAKRALLAEALTWAAVDPVAAFMGQLSDEKRLALQSAVSKFEPLEQVLPNIQANKISEELATNITSALTILKDKTRARLLAQLFLSKHPNLEQLLRVRVNELDENDKINDLRALTESRLDELPSSILAILAEISANRGDTAWNHAVLVAVKKRDNQLEKLRYLEPLKFLAQFRSGDKEEALHGIRQYIGTYQDNVFAHLMESLFLHGLGKPKEALAVAKLCKQQLGQKDINLDTVHLADLLFLLKAYNEASPLFQRLVTKPGDNELTWKLTVCLVSTDQRWAAQALFDALPEATRTQSRFRRLEINLAGQKGDWHRTCLLLEAELTLLPRSAEYIVSYADALHRLGDREALSNFVAKDPDMEASTLNQELVFAKFQMHCGFDDAGVLRLYRLFRSHPNNVNVAGHFLGQLFLAQKPTALNTPEVVMPASAVHLQKDNVKSVIAIESEGFTPFETWQELIGAESDLAQSLLGHRQGDEIVIPRGMTKETVTIVCVESLIQFAVKKAEALIGSSTNTEGPLWSVRIIKDDGKVDIDYLLRLTLGCKDHTQNVLKMYSQYRLPLCVLAKLLGTDPVKLLLEWPSNLMPLFVGFGRLEDLQIAFTLIGNHNRFVIDMVTIAEIVRLNVTDVIGELIGRPLVAQTQRDHLFAILQSMGNPRESAVMGQVNGQLNIINVPLKYYENRKKFLQSMLAFVDNKCDVVLTTGPKEVTEAHQKLRNILDPRSLDSLYLCLEHNASLLSEDGGLRLIAIEGGVSKSTNIQPLLMLARNQGLITPRRYADCLAIKLLANHDFVSVSAADLIEIAIKTPDQIAPAAKAAFETFRRPSFQIESGTLVCLEFVKLAAKNLPPVTLARYTHLLLEVLKHDRPYLEPHLTRAVGHCIQSFFGRNGRKLQPHIRRAFGEKLLNQK